MLPPTSTQLYHVSIRFRRKISFVTSFTISNWLKKYYLKLLFNFNQKVDLLCEQYFKIQSSLTLYLKYILYKLSLKCMNAYQNLFYLLTKFSYYYWCQSFTRFKYWLEIWFVYHNGKKYDPLKRSFQTLNSQNQSLIIKFLNHMTVRNPHF